MDQQTQMKVLLEAVDAPEVDEPKDGFANSPNEQTLDSATQQNFGDDLHKKKSKQFKYKPGDNPRAAKMHEYKLQEDRLTDAFDKFKLVESALRKGMKWDTRKELSELVWDAVQETGELADVISNDEFNIAVQYMWDSQFEDATMHLMQYYATQDGGEPRNWQAISDDLADNLEYISTDLDERASKEDMALETAGDSTGESATLKKLHHEGTDSNAADKVVAKVFGPTDAYPAPWTAQHVGGKYPIYAIKAANRAEVATWLNQTNAEKIVDEVS